MNTTEKIAALGRLYFHAGYEKCRDLSAYIQDGHWSIEELEELARFAALVHFAGDEPMQEVLRTLRGHLQNEVHSWWEAHHWISLPHSDGGKTCMNCQQTKEQHRGSYHECGVSI